MLTRCGVYLVPGLFPSQCRAFGGTPGTTGTPGDATLTHVSADSNMPNMVDVGGKSVTRRVARARCVLAVPSSVMDLLDPEKGEIQSKKGPVFATAIVAGTMAVKRTADLIPFCHPLGIEKCDITIKPRPERGDLLVECTVGVTHKTGVEMEALTGANVAALCVYDMCKAVTHDMVITECRLVSKTGGKSDLNVGAD